MAVIEIAKIQVRRGQENQTGIPQLDPGEFAWAEDTERLYIGKRIAEGASTDENSRILTEQDLNFFKLASQSTGTVNSAYTYRQSDTFIGAVASTVQEKLDQTVSLTDFGVNPSFTATNITTEFRDAINKIFKNQGEEGEGDWQRTNARRNLIIPAGSYIIDSTLELPPYTSLIGEGVDLTILTMTTSSAMFVTVDVEGTGYPSMLTASTQTSRNISIKGMTLAYTATVTATTTDALLSLDNVKGAVVENVKFYSAADGVSTGTGIRLRGHPTGGVDVETCSDIQINHCTFDNLYTGVLATGTVLRPVIGKSIFTNLDKGIVMTSSPTELYRSPIGAKFIENRFDRISDEAIYVGTASHVTNHISEQNTFRHVGNKRGIDSSVTTSTNHSPVISFLADGNSSVNDTFNRKSVAAATTASISTSSFYYNPLVIGNASINSSVVTTATIIASTTTNIIKIPVTGKDQMLFMKYSLYSVDRQTKGYSRKGVLTLNISHDGFGSINDRFNYSKIDENMIDPVFKFVENFENYTARGYTVLQCAEAVDVFKFEAQVDAIV
jgi:hypothetical protein